MIKKSFSRNSKSKLWFSLFEMMIVIWLIWMLWSFMLTMIETIAKHKHQVATVWYFNTTISRLDSSLHTNISNADKIVYPWIDNDFCEWMSWWTISSQWWDTWRASLNDQNLDKKWRSENWVEQAWYTMSDVPWEWIMFCDQMWRINFIWLAKKYLPKKWTEHNVLVHYQNRRIKELTPVDNVTSDLRSRWSIPQTDREHLQFITPMNIWILKIEFDYPFNNLQWQNRAEKWSVDQTTMSSVDVKILFEYSWLTWWEQIRSLYKYYKTVNLKNTIE